MSSPTLVVCRCVHTEFTPAPVLHTVLAALQTDFPGRVEVVDDLCGLCARRDERLARWAAGPVAVFACFERAVRWLFDAAGAPLPNGAKVLNLRSGTAHEIIDEFRAASPASETRDPRPACHERSLGETRAPQPPGFAALCRGEPTPDPLPPASWIPWFPVIDYARCQHCRKCANFCLFGVYATEGDTVRVARPASCKNNCPACARLCPHAAIMFPKYAQPPINGDAVTEQNIGRENVGVELIGRADGDVLEMLRQRAAAIDQGKCWVADEGSPKPPGESALPASVQAVLDAARKQPR